MKHEEPNLQLIFDGIKGHALIQTNLEAKVVGWNDGAELLLGYSRSEIMGIRASIFFTPEDLADDVEEKEMKQARETGQAEDKRWHVKKDGSRFFANGIMNSLKNADGELIGYIKVMNDDTERLKIQERFDAATIRTGVGVWDYDIATNTAWRSPSHDFLHGYYKVLPDWSLEIALEHIHPDDRKRFKDTMMTAISNHKSWSVDYRIIWPDQSIHWVVANGHMVFDEDNKPVKIVGTTVDITKRKLAEEKLTETVKDLQSETNLRDRFVAALSHDLRTPINTAKLSAQVLRRNYAYDDKVVKSSERIASNLDRVDNMIQDLLDATRIKAGEKVPLKREHINLANVIHSTIDDLRQAFGNRFEIVEVDHVKGFWDSGGIKRIIENLCNNAIKYGDPSAPIKLTISLDSPEVAKIQVQNYGHIISAQDLQNFFKPFQRSESALLSGKKGWGIGLMLVKAIVDAHGGEINVRSTVEEGTTFSIFLPLNLK